MLRAFLATAFLAPLALAQGDPVGLPREKMWAAPTAEDWAKPCLITWQRTWEDALAVSRETGRAILVCVNMDGEIASEHYAGVRYRQPEIAPLYEPYVTVIASVYRHTPRDHDEQGNRIPCPRFGGVTCGEHIAIEPVLYEKFFEGERVAPRHIMIELDGAETYDIYYAFDTASVFTAVRNGIANRNVPVADSHGDRPLMERVGSADVRDQVAVEQAYKAGDKAMRRRLLQAALVTEMKPLDLLRLALFGLDLELARTARQALAQTTSPAAVDLIAEALRVPMEPDEREALIAALERLGETSPQAKTLAAVHRGLGSRSTKVDVAAWAQRPEGASPVKPTDWFALESQAEYMAKATASRPDDAAAQLELAEASLALAVDSATSRMLSTDTRTSSKYARLMFEDVRRAAYRAEKLGAGGWRIDAIIAVAEYKLGNRREAYSRAERAAENVPPGDESWNSMAVFEYFAHARQRAITRAVVRKEKWPQEWLTDVDAAYSVLAKHPHGMDGHFADHYDFLKWLRARGRAASVLAAGLERFPESWILHDRLRGKLLAESGVDALEKTYAAMLGQPDAATDLAWFAGYAALVAAEQHRRTPDAERAQSSYGRAIELFERAIAANPNSRDTADHYIALAHAGRAKLAMEGNRNEAAVHELLASFARRPDAAASRDGLNLSAVDTAKMLLTRLDETEGDLAAQLQAALDDLDPMLLELPEFERQGPRRRGGGQGAAGQGR